jgi:hypothetical protein
MLQVVLPLHPLMLLSIRQPALPTTPVVGAITQPTCTVATGSVVLSGLPAGNWTINPGAITGTGATTTINNLLPVHITLQSPMLQVVLLHCIR